MPVREAEVQSFTPDPEARNTMNHARPNGLPPPGGITARPPPDDSVRQNVSVDDIPSATLRTAIQVRRALVAAGFALAKVVVQAATWTVFRRIQTHERARFPANGPVLVVANHPAAWVDVMVLDAALGRKLHFITWAPLFHPWARGVLLELFGSLPIRFGHEDPDRAVNRATFDRCQTLFRRGEVVAFFPEGVSRGDRTIEPLKPGAARLAIEAAATGSTLCMIPVAIRYEDRSRFRSDVAVMVGSAIPIRAEDVSNEDQSGEFAVRALTARIAGELEALLAEAGEQARRTARFHEARTPLRLQDPILAAAGILGVIVHAIPAVLIEAAARAFTRGPHQTMLGRVGAGLVLLPLWYLLLAFLTRRVGLSALVVIAAPLLGVAACRFKDRLDDLRERKRVS